MHGSHGEHGEMNAEMVHHHAPDDAADVYGHLIVYVQKDAALANGAEGALLA